MNGVQGEAGVYRPIDTTSLDSMLRGVARRNLREVPTSRYGRGAVDVLAADTWHHQTGGARTCAPDVDR